MNAPRSFTVAHKTYCNVVTETGQDLMKITCMLKVLSFHDFSVFQGDDQAGKYSQWPVDPGFPSGLVIASISMCIRCSQKPNIHYTAL